MNAKEEATAYYNNLSNDAFGSKVGIDDPKVRDRNIKILVEALERRDSKIAELENDNECLTKLREKEEAFKEAKRLAELENDNECLTKLREKEEAFKEAKRLAEKVADLEATLKEKEDELKACESLIRSNDEGKQWLEFKEAKETIKRLREALEDVLVAEFEVQTMNEEAVMEKVQRVLEEMNDETSICR